MLCLAVAVAMAPLMFGSVTTEAQGVLGILLGLSLWFISREWRLGTPILPRWLQYLFLGGLIFSLLPLPLAVVKLISPARVDLALRFPLGPEVPDWSASTLSPALTLRWGWQFILLLVAFSLVRQVVRRPYAVVWLMVALGAGIAGQVGAELAYRGTEEKLILGLWPVRWGNSAGTFANRNHFAGWLMMAALMLAAVALRYLKPLRSSRPTGAVPPAKVIWAGWLALGLAGAGVVFALMSGSRSGLLALLCGGLMLVLGVKHHSVSRRRGFALATLVLLLMLVALPFAGPTLDRLSKMKDETSASYAKWRLWGDALTIFTKYPVTGTGPGTFVRSNILYKTAGGESTAWHAENDVLQWLSETGLWGLIVLGGGVVMLWRKVGRWFWSPQWKTAEPELMLGALAGLVAIMMHSLFDFPWQVMANALLGAVILGVVVGLHDAHNPEAEFKLASRRHGWLLAGGGLVLLLVGVMAIWGFREYRLAQQKDVAAKVLVGHVERSMQLWPLNLERANLWLRLNVAELQRQPRAEAADGAEQMRKQFTGYLAGDPLNWELRLERAWLDLAFMKDRQAALQEPMRVTGLNPKQALIPLRFAGVLADRDPEKAWDFLLAADVTQERLLQERLEIAWQIRPDATQLWPLVPATDNGYRALAEFAFGKKLPLLARSAYEKMRLPPPAAERAEKFLLVHRPDLALQVLPEIPGTTQERLMLAKVHGQLGDAPRCLRLLEPLFQGEAEWQRATPLDSPGSALLRVWKSGDRTVRLALQVAEVVMTEPPERRDVGLLQQLYGTYPGEKRLLWLNYRTRMDRHEYREAAQLAITLADKIAPAK